MVMKMLLKKAIKTMFIDSEQLVFAWFQHAV